MSKEETVTKKLQEFSDLKPQGVSAREIAVALQINRSTASRYLNDLFQNGQAEKITGKPVRYRRKTSRTPKEIGESLQPLIQQGLAALSYPFQSFHILFTGETGTGKTYLAERLYEIATREGYIKRSTPFITFNCADYAQNPELLVGQIFGIKKGAFTGSVQDEPGLVEQADGGILFLDEIHRLPASAQEMLFYLIDKGVYRRFGEATRERQANITFIGATTQSPERALLITLLRRFSVTLIVPPLRERSHAEREMLLELFLQQEADKMDADLSMEDAGRDKLLHYACPGNIGQLQNDIQIACARAYLRYLNKEFSEVLVGVEDILIKMDEGQTSFPLENEQAKAAQITKGESHSLFPNIYQRLNKKRLELSSAGDMTVESSLQHVVNQYIADLTARYPKVTFSYDVGHDLIDGDLLYALQRAPTVLSPQINRELNEQSMYVIGLHLQNLRNHGRENKQTLPSFSKASKEDRYAAHRLAEYLTETIDLKLPDDEVELLAHFLTPVQQSQSLPNAQTIFVLLVTHGRTTASSMAEVTNTLLGAEVIQSVDMPLEKSAEDTNEEVRVFIDRALASNTYQGVLLLVDMGSLVTMGDTFYSEWGVPVFTVPYVNMPMVMEAGRKSLVQDITVKEVYETTQKAMTAFMSEDHSDPHTRKKRLIATVCFTGEGAAQLLEEWLADQLTDADADVVIRSVRVDPVSRDTSILRQLKDYYDIVAIIGTVFISMDEIPFIPAWELLKQEGTSRLLKLVEVTRQYGVRQGETTQQSHGRGYREIQSGLAEIVTYLNPRLFCTILDKYFPQVQAYYDWDDDRALGMSMHIGVLLDRMIKAHVHGEIEELKQTIPMDNHFQYDQAERSIWEPLVSSLEQSFQIPFPESFVRVSMKISR
ncbi:sigma 54-interacting transcriptional regulator [Salicibibacter cibi]|uniref:Sigma 54-interacting transcriptional regulator n=1 Tax=Salicibibacter cibi TaxID=2743001 RepID=A0A7T7CE12_9BACI|nr:sigma 54-interacting transcriptional regulator [Salicibibacter cibi]QQK78589.1 sigma 54-interacting transcriptional regulator [Salicibibacter cibi]